MAIIKAVSSRASITTAINYVTKKEKTKPELVSGINCDPNTVREEMEVTKMLWNKTGGRTYQHYVHSYDAYEKITPEQAHQNTIELIEGTEAWKGFEVLVATHIDRKHIHTHIIINSVNFENGHKLQMGKKDLEELKKRCDEQSKKQGLHIQKKGKNIFGTAREETVAWKKDTYDILKKAEKGEVKSYVMDIALAVMDCKETAISRDDFIKKMKGKGVDVAWNDNHKYITFTDLQRMEKGEKKCKVRNNKLSQYYAIDFGKEALEYEFETNARTAEACAATEERARKQLEHSDQPTSRSNKPINDGVGKYESRIAADAVKQARLNIADATADNDYRRAKSENNSTGQHNKSITTRCGKVETVISASTAAIIAAAKSSLAESTADIHYKRTEGKNRITGQNHQNFEPERARINSKNRNLTEGKSESANSSISEQIRKSRTIIASERNAIEQSNLDREDQADAIRQARINNEQRRREDEIRKENERIEEQNRITRENERESIRERRISKGKSR